MEALRKEHEGLEKENLGMSIKDIDQVIELMERAREGIAADPESGRLALAKLKNATKTPLDNANKHLKPIHEALKGYSKALDKKFKDKPLPSAENDALSSHPVLINRALAMHLLREGQFSVASTFIEEANRQAPVPEPTPGTPDPYMEDVWQKELANGKFDSKKLQEQFGEMYNILHELRMQKNLTPAIQWARQNRTVLENRGSNLEFELCRLQFICLYMGHDSESPTMDPELGPVRAWQYAYKEFQPFQYRYAKELQQLIGAMAFYTNVWDSPYRRLFHNDSAWEEVATSFTREFCSLLGLSADSPLYIAATAGSIALPTFLKLQNIMKQKHTEWTTSHELPVEIPLPPGYQFHSIFVCPVSKEQATDANPAMMMTCGHVICRESMERLSKNGRFKCPYCPIESYSKDARRVYL